MDNFVFVAHIEKITSLRKILNQGVLYDTKEKYHYPPLNILYSDDDGKYNWVNHIQNQLHIIFSTILMLLI